MCLFIYICVFTRSVLVGLRIALDFGVIWKSPGGWRRAEADSGLFAIAEWVCGGWQRQRRRSAAELVVPEPCTLHWREKRCEKERPLGKGDRAAKAYLREELHQVPVDCPGGYTSYRPQDQRYINFLVQHRYQRILEDIVGHSDFRENIDQIEPWQVSLAYALAFQWLADHPESNTKKEVIQ